MLERSLGSSSFSSFRSSFRSSKELFAYLGVSEEFDDKTFPVFVPKALAAKIRKAGKESALWKQFVPHPAELSEEGALKGLYDPIGDGVHSKGSGIIHRYKNRILFSPTTVCPVNCRYCFRKSELAQKDDMLKGRLEELELYLKNHPEVEEVILTGGDPLILSDAKLEAVIERLKGKIKYLRFHTRTPMIMPERITPSLLDLLKNACEEFEIVTMAVHANHTQEFCPEVKKAVKKLSGSGVQLLSQSVLLKDVNSTVKELVGLYQLFGALNVRPYYLHHPDRVKGAMRFYLPLEEGRQIYGRLRDELPGWMLPHYVIDSESGSGKNLAYNPESIAFSGILLDRFNQPQKLSR
ncbi:MAG: KamA family radical SAM protein [Bacteriovoracaceae bacterium]